MDTRHLNGYVDDDGEFYGNEEIIESIADADTPETFYPTCRYCGVQTLPDAAYESQEQANEAGTMRCNCYEAKQYQEEKERAERRVIAKRVTCRLQTLRTIFCCVVVLPCLTARSAKQR